MSCLRLWMLFMFLLLSIAAGIFAVLIAQTSIFIAVLLGGAVFLVLNFIIPPLSNSPNARGVGELLEGILHLFR